MNQRVVKEYQIQAHSTNSLVKLLHIFMHLVNYNFITIKTKNYNQQKDNYSNDSVEKLKKKKKMPGNFFVDFWSLQYKVVRLKTSQFWWLSKKINKVSFNWIVKVKIIRHENFNCSTQSIPEPFFVLKVDKSVFLLNEKIKKVFN